MAFRGRMAASQRPPIPSAFLEGKAGEIKIRTEEGKKFAQIPVRIESLMPSEKLTRREREQQLKRNIARSEDLEDMRLVRVSLSLFSLEEIIETSACEITNANLEGQGSINDTRMGAAESDKTCSSCDKLPCDGHLGHIRFATMVNNELVETPIYHPQMMREIVKVLHSVCNTCGSLLLSPDMLREKGILKLSGPSRLTEIEKASKERGVKCLVSRRGQSRPDTDSKCGPIQACVPNPVYSTEDLANKCSITYYADKKEKSRSRKDERQPMLRTVEETYSILNAISSEHAVLLGFENGSHPRNMISRAWPVMPPTARPPKIQDGEFKPHNLTLAYREIIKAKLNVDKVRRGEETPRRGQKTDTSAVNALEKARNQLFSAVSRLLENRDNTIRTRGGRFIPISELLQGKDALIRGMMMGKRGNFCARTVLTGDPSLKFGEIAVPLAFAKVLTQREIVLPYNIGYLRSLHKAGRLTHITLGKGRGSLREHRRQILPSDVLQLGDVVERWMQDGDIVIFNRQPTLHKESMMAYRAVIKDQLTIGLHMSPSTPHNYDFDGDEGAIYVPVGYPAKFEASEVMNVINCVMSGQQNKPMMGLPYNAPLSAYKMTDPLTEVDPILMADCMMAITMKEDLPTLPQRLKEAKVPANSGKALFSALLPAGFTYIRGKVVIINGILVSGVITASDIGTEHRSIVQEMWKRYGSARTAGFLTDATFVLGRWLEQNPETIGMRDLQPDNPDITRLKEEDFASIRRNVESLGRQQADPILEEARERNILANVKTSKGLGLRMVAEVFAGPRERAIALEKKLPSEGKNVTTAIVQAAQAPKIVCDEKVPSDKLEKATESTKKLDNAIASLKDVSARIDMLHYNNNSFALERDLIRLGPFLPADYLSSITKYGQLEDAVRKLGENKDEKAEDLYQRMSNELKIVEDIHVANRGVQALDNKSAPDVVTTAVGTMVRAAKLGHDLLPPSDNALSVMTDQGSGSKGSALNVAQIRGSVGQQHYRGGRLPATLAGGKCLPTEDTGLQSRGFICSSYFEGLKSDEFFHLLSGGRESLLAIATSVSASGSIQHKMIKAMESLSIKYDGSVRNSREAVFQWVFGGDGFDASNLVKINMPGFDNMSSFIDLESVAAELNVSMGFVPK